MKDLRRYFSAGMCAGVIALATTSAVAQEDPAKYPSRPIHIIVGFTAGGGNDIIARVYGKQLSESLGQPVIIENKPGGGAIVATEYVAKSAPDGYTLLVGASGMAINPAVYAKLPYDSVRDFVAISELASFPQILIVNPSSPIKSVAGLVAYAKANPGKTSYSSSSVSFQLVTELFKQKTGAPVQLIPSKGANDSLQAVIAGQVTATFADAGPALSQVLGGQARALAVTSLKRITELSDVPTLKEAGADIDAVLWSGLFAPKDTPPEIVKKLEGEIMRIAKLPEVIARLSPLGILPVGNSSEEFSRILAADIARWSEVAKAGNIKIAQSNAAFAGTTIDRPEAVSAIPTDSISRPASGFIKPESYPTLPLNSGPQAFMSGMLFHEAIPLGVRKSIINDLAWLQGLGRLPASTGLSKMLGLYDPAKPALELEGADLVQYIVTRVRLVLSESTCNFLGEFYTSEDQVLNIFDHLGFVLTATEKRRCLIEHPSVGAAGYDRGVRVPRFRPIQMENQVVPVMLDPVMVINLNSYVFTDQSSSLIARIARLAVILHEAGHRMYTHMVCPANGASFVSVVPLVAPFVDLAQTKTGFYTLGEEAKPACAGSLADSFGIESLFWAAMGLWCAENGNCRFEDRLSVSMNALACLSRIALPIPASVRNEILKNYDQVLRLPVDNPDRSKMEFRPPVLFLKLYGAVSRQQIEWCSQQQGRCHPDQISFLKKKIEFVTRVDAIYKKENITEWSDVLPVRPKEPPVYATGIDPTTMPRSETERWVIAVQDAQNVGFNLPVRFAIPCRAVRGCSAPGPK